MLEQIPAAGRGASFLDSLDKTGLILQHSVDSFLDDLLGLFTGAGREIAEASLFFRRKMHFHLFKIKSDGEECQMIE